MTDLPLRRGTTKRLGIRQPRRPVLLLESSARLTAEEMENFKARFRDAQFQPGGPVVLNVSGGKAYPLRGDVAYIKAAGRQGIWPFRKREKR